MVRLNDVYSHEELQALLRDRSNKETALFAERRLFDSYHEDVTNILRGIRESMGDDVPMGIMEMRGARVPVYRTQIGLSATDNVSFVALL